MIGTLLNIATVLAGGTLGLLFGSRLPDRLRKTVIAGLGLFTLAYGLYNFLKTQNPLIVLGSLLVGALLGDCKTSGCGWNPILTANRLTIPKAILAVRLCPPQAFAPPLPGTSSEAS
jgi:hypothetical protein